MQQHDSIQWIVDWWTWMTKQSWAKGVPPLPSTAFSFFMEKLLDNSRLAFLTRWKELRLSSRETHTLHWCASQQSCPTPFWEPSAAVFTLFMVPVFISCNNGVHQAVVVELDYFGMIWESWGWSLLFVFFSQLGISNTALQSDAWAPPVVFVFDLSNSNLCRLVLASDASAPIDVNFMLPQQCCFENELMPRRRQLDTVVFKMN